MREKHIFPASVLEQSADQLFTEKSHLSGILYLTVLLCLVGSLVAIKFIHVDVNVRVSGIIKPREDHTVVLATTSGFIEARNLALNAEVSEGDTLAIIRSELITAKLPSLESRKKELKALITDLTQLTTLEPTKVNLVSPMYKQDVLYYLSQWSEAETKRKQAQALFERSKKLYEANVIPLSDFEPTELQYEQAQNSLHTLTDYQQRQWQSDLIGYKAELRELDAIGIRFMFSNTQTGKFYVPPKDVGYLRTGSKGRVQVSSFNYTEWGVLIATVVEIFDDVSVSSDGTQSFYKVYCSLNDDHLTLKNGYKGYLKKGMVVNTNFLITRRTVFQLLYDKVNDWLNPNIQRNYE